MSAVWGTPQWFACWRFRAWNAKLQRRRLTLWTAEALLESAHSGFTGTTADDKDCWRRQALRAEKRVTWALIRRNTWKKQACENCRMRVQRSNA